MEALLAQLPEPHSIWQQFHAISQIPRGSHNTEHIADWLVNFGREHGCEAQKDAAGNVLIRVPASAGKEDKPIVCLQGHMDMVCEKATDSAHNFATDPIQWRIVGEHLMANNTTLGADNGIGVAAAMVFVVDRTLIHGPLELLFTCDEEVGLIGATGLGAGVLKAQYLINCDSEEEHAICVGCAGGFVSKAKIPLTRLEAVPANMTLMHVHLTGLRGGHSGVDIHKEFGNGIKLLVRMLKHAQQQEFLLVSIKGGSAHNAIPREVHAMVYVPTPRVAEFTEDLHRIAGAIGKEYATVEPHMVLHVNPADSAEHMAPCDRPSTIRAVNFLNTIPSGVLRMAAEVPGLVETSFSLTVVTTFGDHIHCTMSGRSSRTSQLLMCYNWVHSLCELAGVELGPRENQYPGWVPVMDSPLLQAAKDVHAEMRLPCRVYAIHAGLECGVIMEKHPNMSAISLGPTIENPHSPSERLLIPSVPRFFHILLATLAKLSA